MLCSIDRSSKTGEVTFPLGDYLSVITGVFSLIVADHRCNSRSV